MPDARIQIVNEALAMFGADDIAGWDDETTRNRSVVLTYNRIHKAAFGHSYKWRFATQTPALSLLAETPSNGWKYAFERPGDALSAPVRILTDPQRPQNPLREFAYEAGKIYTNVKPVWGAFIYDVDPDIWPGSFRNFFVTAIAAELVVPETNDTNLRAALQLEAWGRPEEYRAGGLCRVAINEDISSAPIIATPVTPDPLTMARR